MYEASPLSQAFARRSRTIARLRQSRVIHICGAPGTGKTTIAVALAARLGIPAFGIDAERIKLLKPEWSWPTDDVRSWTNLEDQIDAASRCIVETSGLHGNDVMLLGGRRVLRVICTADRPVREQRLTTRIAEGYPLVGDQADYVARLLRLPSPRLAADLIADTSRPGSVESIISRITKLADRLMAAE